MMQAQPAFALRYDSSTHRPVVHGYDPSTHGYTNKARYPRGTGAFYSGGHKHNTAFSTMRHGWGWHSKQKQQQHSQPSHHQRNRDDRLTVEHFETQTKKGKAGVPVFIDGLPNNLCNPTCMEAILDQAGLEESIVTCEAWPGVPCGQATLHMATLDAANRAAKHFHGCRWDSTGAGVAARVGCVESKSMLAEKGCPTDIDAQTHATTDHKDDTELVTSCNKDDNIDCKPSPTLSAASTTFSPLTSPSFSFTTRKMSWADVASDDEEDTCFGATEEESPATETCSGGTSTSEDGF